MDGFLRLIKRGLSPYFFSQYAGVMIGIRTLLQFPYLKLRKSEQGLWVETLIPNKIFLSFIRNRSLFYKLSRVLTTGNFRSYLQFPSSRFLLRFLSFRCLLSCYFFAFVFSIWKSCYRFFFESTVSTASFA